MGLLLDKFLVHYDTLHHGFTRPGIAHGVTATVGRSWAIPGAQGVEEVAAVAMYRGTAKASSVDYTHPVGLALGKSLTVKNFTYRNHVADTWYLYDQRAVNGAGVISARKHEPMRFLTDGSGNIINPVVPAPVARVTAVAKASGKAEIIAMYAPHGQAVAPTDLRVYGVAVADPLDTATELATLFTAPNLLTDDVTGLTEITAEYGKARYDFTVQAQVDGEFWIFGAVFRNAGGVAAGNTAYSNVIRIHTSEPAKTDDFQVIQNAT